MTRKRKIILGVAATMVAGIGWYAYCSIYTLEHLQEAYAAWDTGTLLVEYMKEHDDRWPSSWNELLTVLDSEPGRSVILRGAGAGDRVYARSLQTSVLVNWGFDTKHLMAVPAVTRLNGGPFPVVWEEPNEMVRKYLSERASTRTAEKSL